MVALIWMMMYVSWIGWPAVVEVRWMAPAKNCRTEVDDGSRKSLLNRSTKSTRTHDKGLVFVAGTIGSGCNSLHLSLSFYGAKALLLRST